jgi:glycosyltransferase involved in cell wall biosynthesis
MLNFTKGEGFGRPLLEFSLTGKPVIVSNWSGHLDFLKEGSVLLEGELKNVHESAADQFLLKDSQWFNVNVSKALPVIKDVYKNYDKYKVASFQLGKQNKQNFGLEKMTKLFDVILNQYGIYTKIQPKFQQLQLPKLKMLNK